MGLSTKQVTGDLPAIEWPAGKTTSSRLGALELPKPPLPARRQQPPQQQWEPLKCPRCGSTNTKFCYYNNYSKSQPRHFCKHCKRHWTKGGTLRNVPVCGSRKNKRPNIPAATKATGIRDGSDTGNLKGLPDALHNPLTKSPLLLRGKSDNSINIISSGLNPNNDLFQFSSLSALQMGSSLTPISIEEPLNAFGPYPGNLDSIKESTITSVNNILSSSGGPWPGPVGDGSLELPDYWNWNEIDALASSYHLNISRGDEDTTKIKP